MKTMSVNGTQDELIRPTIIIQRHVTVNATGRWWSFRLIGPGTFNESASLVPGIFRAERGLRRSRRSAGSRGHRIGLRNYRHAQLNRRKKFRTEPTVFTNERATRALKGDAVDDNIARGLRRTYRGTYWRRSGWGSAGAGHRPRSDPFIRNRFRILVVVRIAIGARNRL